MPCELHPKGPFLRNGKCRPCTRIYNKQYYLDRKAGIVRKKPVVDRTCEKHLTAIIWKNGSCKSCYLEKWRLNNPEKCAELEAARDPKERKAQHRKSHHKRKDKISVRRRAERLERKILVLTHYAGGEPACAHCTERRFSALGLDHKDDNGAAHRRGELKRGGDRTYRWAVKTGYPDVFQVLCHNCNWIKHLETIVRNNTRSSFKARTRVEKFHHAAIDHYSHSKNTCAICSQSDMRVLSIDHPNQNGAAHRKELGILGGLQFYVWLTKHEYPPGYRVLCMSCNLADFLERKAVTTSALAEVEPRARNSGETHDH